MKWMDDVTFGVALVGAVLGVVNTWWALWRDRVRLRIVPLWHTGDMQMENGQMTRVTSAYVGALEAQPDGRLGVCVINRGFVPVTVESVGFTPTGWRDRHFRKAKLVRRFIAGDAGDLTRLPKVIGPREAITIWCAAAGAGLDAKLKGAQRVYVNTACGLDVFATSRLFRRLVSEASRLRKNL